MTDVSVPIQAELFNSLLPYITNMGIKDSKFTIDINFTGKEMEFDVELIKSIFSEATSNFDLDDCYGRCRYIQHRFNATFIDDRLGAYVFNLFNNQP